MLDVGGTDHNFSLVIEFAPLCSLCHVRKRLAMSCHSVSGISHGRDYAVSALSLKNPAGVRACKADMRFIAVLSPHAPGDAYLLTFFGRSTGMLERKLYELKPCPFCQSTSVKQDRRKQVHCHECHASAREDMWNRRPREDELIAGALRLAAKSYRTDPADDIVSREETNGG